MIKHRQKRTIEADEQAVPITQATLDTRSYAGKRRWFGLAAKNPTRSGTSQHVLDVAKRMMKEYHADLDYLKDR